MKLNYLFKTEDADLRAKAVVHAIFNENDKEIQNHLPGVTITITDKSPGFIIFEPSICDHPTIGWRLAAKQFSEALLGYKCDVVRVGARAEELYKESLKNKEVKYEVKIMPKVIDSKLLSGETKILY